MNQQTRTPQAETAPAPATAEHTPPPANAPTTRRRHRTLLRAAWTLLLLTGATLLTALLATPAHAEPNDPNTATGPCQWGTFDTTPTTPYWQAYMTAGSTFPGFSEAGKHWNNLPDDSGAKQLIRAIFGSQGSSAFRSYFVDDMSGAVDPSAPTRPDNPPRAVWNLPQFGDDAASKRIYFPFGYNEDLAADQTTVKPGMIRPLRGLKVSIKFAQGHAPGDSGMPHVMGTGKLDDYGQVIMDQVTPTERPQAFPVTGWVGSAINFVSTPSTNPAYEWRLWFEYTLDDGYSAKVYAGDKSVSQPYVIRTTPVTMPSFPEDYLRGSSSPSITRHFGHSCGWKMPSSQTAKLDLESLTSDQQRGLFAFDSIREARDLASISLPNLPIPPVEVRTPDINYIGDPNNSFYGGLRIIVGRNVSFNLAMIQHEYGHYLQDLSHVSSPPETPYAPYEHSIGLVLNGAVASKSAAIRKVFFESAADFVTFAAQGETIHRLGFYGDFPFAPGGSELGDLSLHLPGYSALEVDGDPEKNHYPSVGEDDRTTVDRLLYRLSGIPRSSGQNPRDELLRMILSGSSSSLSDFYRQYVRSSTPSNYEREVDCLFSAHRVAPKIDYPYDHSLLGRDPLTLEVQDGNNGVDHFNRVPAPNDDLTVEVWSSDYSALLGAFPHVEIDQATGSYRVPAAGWGALWDAHVGEVVHVTVAGSASAVPGSAVLNVTTGPYRSCAKTFTLLRPDEFGVRYQSGGAARSFDALVGRDVSGGLGVPARDVLVRMRQFVPDALGVERPDPVLSSRVTDVNGVASFDMSDVGAVEPHGLDHVGLYLEVVASGPDGAAADDSGGEVARRSQVLSLPVGEPIPALNRAGQDPLDMTNESLTDVPDAVTGPDFADAAAVATRDDSYEVIEPNTLMVWNANAGLDEASPAEQDLVREINAEFEVHDALVSAADYYAVRQGVVLSGGPVVRTGSQPASFGPLFMRVRTEPFGVSWDEVFHYYAKWALTRRGVPVADVSRPPTPGVNAAQVSGKDNGRTQAWYDGFADYFAVSARVELARLGRLPLTQLDAVADPPVDAVSSRFSSSAYSYDLGGADVGAVVGSGEASQRSVGRSLFQVGSQRGFNTVWDSVLRFQNSSVVAASFAAFHNRLYGSALPWAVSGFRQYACVLAANTIAPKLADGTRLDLTQPSGSVTWTPGGGGGFTNSKFHVEVLSVDYGLLYSVDVDDSSGNAVTYTFTPGQWNAIKAAAAAAGSATVRVAVSGRQTASSVTPSVSSWYPGCSPGSDRTGDVVLVMETPVEFPTARFLNSIVFNWAAGWIHNVLRDSAAEVFATDPDARVAAVVYSDWDCVKAKYAVGSIASYLVPKPGPPTPGNEMVPMYYLEGGSEVPLPVTCGPRVLVPFQTSAAAFTVGLEDALEDTQYWSCFDMPSGSSESLDLGSVSRSKSQIDCFENDWVPLLPLDLAFADPAVPAAERMKQAGLSAVKLALGMAWRPDTGVARNVVLLHSSPVKDPEVTPTETLTADSVAALAKAAGAGTGGAVAPATAKSGPSDPGRPGHPGGPGGPGGGAGTAPGSGVHVSELVLDGGGVDPSLLRLATATGGTVEKTGSGTVTAAMNRVVGFMSTGRGGPVTSTGASAPSVSITTDAAGRTANVLPANLALAASATGNGASVAKVEWDFDYDGRSFDVQATGTSVSRQFTTEFVGTVAVKATDSAGRWTIATAGVYVNAAPAMTPQGGPWTTAQVPGAVHFNLPASDPSGELRWEWDFDGNDTFTASESTSGPAVDHVFTAVFAGPVRVRVVDRFGAWAQAELPVQVYQAPHAVISGGPFTASGYTHRFTMSAATSTPGSGGAVTACEWDWNNDGVLQVVPGMPELSDVPASAAACTQPVASWRYVVPGQGLSYTGSARLTVIDAAGHRGSATVKVQLDSRPPSITINGATGTGLVALPARVGAPYVLDVSASDTQGGTVTKLAASGVQAMPGGFPQWLVDPWQPVQSSPGRWTIPAGWPAGSTFTLTFQAADDDGEVTQRQVVVTYGDAMPAGYPSASIVMSPAGDCPSVGCTKTFTAPSGAGLSYDWDFNGDFVWDSHAASLSKTFPQTFSGNVLLQVTGTAGRRSTGVVALNVNNQAPVARLSLTTTAPKYFLPVYVDARGSTDDSAIAKYEWDWNGDGRYDTTTTSGLTSHIYWDTSTAAIPTTVKVRVSDASNATSTTSVSLPPVGFAAPAPPPPTNTAPGMHPILNGPFNATPGQSITFDASHSYLDASAAAIVEYAWDLDGDGLLDVVRAGTVSAPPAATYAKYFPTATTGTTWVRVKDSYGRYAVASAPLRVNWPIPTVTLAGGPRLSAQLDPVRGTTALTLDASASKSNAPNATITNYSWVLEDDFYLNPLPCPDSFTFICTANWRPYASGKDKAVLTYNASSPSNLHGTLTVTDSTGLSATQDFDIVITRGTPPTVTAGGPYTCRVGSIVDGCQLTGPVTATSAVPADQLHGYSWLMQPSKRHDPWWRWGCEEHMFLVPCSPGNTLHPGWADVGSGPYSYPGPAGVEPTILFAARDVDNNPLYATAHVDQVPNPQTVTFVKADGTPLAPGGYTGVAGSPITLRAAATAAGFPTVLGYDWDFTNNNSVDRTTTTNTFAPIYTQPGTYTARITVRYREIGSFGDQAGRVWDSSATVTVPITITAAGPVANAGPDRIARPNTDITLDGSASTGGTAPVTYTWDFGDSTPPVTGTAKTVTHHWAAPGSYTTRLTMTDAANRTATDTAIITVANPPIAVIGPAPVHAAAGLPVNLSGAGSTGGQLTYDWDFGDGTTHGTGATPSHSYTGPGPYTLTLTVRDGLGATSTTSTTVTIEAAPTANAGPDQTGTAGTAMTFHGGNSTGYGLGYSWNWGDGTPDTGGQDPTHVYTNGGTYTVRLTVTDTFGRPATDTATITVAGPLTVNAGPDRTVQALALVDFTGTATGGTAPYTYTWSFSGDNNPYPGANVTHSWPTPGPGQAVLTVTDAHNVTVQDAAQITVTPAPLTVNAGPDRTTTAGTTLTLTGTPSGGTGPYTYTWNYGDNTTNGTTQTVTHTWPTANQTYTITLTINDNANHTATDTLTVKTTATTTCGGYCTEVLTDTPLGYWRLGETTSTTTADNAATTNTTYDGTYTPGTGTITLGQTGATTDNNTAATFTINGQDRVAINTNLNPSAMTNMTLETWVKTPHTATTERLLGDAGTSSSYGTWLGINGNGYPTLTINNGTATGANSTTIYTLTGTQKIDDNTWHHLTATRTGTGTNATITLYIDGQQNTTGTNTVTTTPPTTTTYLAQRWTSTNTNTYTLDEPAIYNTTLTPTRITTHYTNHNN